MDIRRPRSPSFEIAHSADLFMNLYDDSPDLYDESPDMIRKIFEKLAENENNLTVMKEETVEIKARKKIPSPLNENVGWML